MIAVSGEEYDIDQFFNTNKLAFKCYIVIAVPGEG